MWRNTARAASATSFWVAAVGMMLVSTVDEGDPLMGHWSILFALVACVLTGWHLLEMERVRVEHIARIAAEAAVERIRLEVVK